MLASTFTLLNRGLINIRGAIASINTNESGSWFHDQTTIEALFRCEAIFAHKLTASSRIVEYYLHLLFALVPQLACSTFTAQKCQVCWRRVPRLELYLVCV